MKLLVNTNLIPIFKGTYNTFWEICEYEDDGEEIEIDYDFNDFMKSIVETYKDNEENILEALGVDFIRSVKISETYFTPREYNFKTDQLDFVLDINKSGLLRALKKLENNKDFEQYLKDNFSSYDGFWSFTPNNYKELYKEITTEGDEYCQSISALIWYLAKDSKKDIELEIYEEWSGNGYGGLDYKLVVDKDE